MLRLTEQILAQGTTDGVQILDVADHPWPFVLLKTLGIGLLCGYLTVAKNFRCARIGLWLVAVGYAVLLGWHFYLLSWLGVGG